MKRWGVNSRFFAWQACREVGESEHTCSEAVPLKRRRKECFGDVLFEGRPSLDVVD